VCRKRRLIWRRTVAAGCGLADSAHAPRGSSRIRITERPYCDGNRVQTTTVQDVVERFKVTEEGAT
jgi:hypothetical protein